jgi:hypothetical protein
MGTSPDFGAGKTSVFSGKFKNQPMTYFYREHVNIYFAVNINNNELLKGTTSRHPFGQKIVPIFSFLFEPGQAPLGAGKLKFSLPPVGNIYFAVNIDNNALLKMHDLKASLWAENCANFLAGTSPLGPGKLKFSLPPVGNIYFAVNINNNELLKMHDCKASLN